MDIYEKTKKLLENVLKRLEETEINYLSFQDLELYTKIILNIESSERNENLYTKIFKNYNDNFDEKKDKNQNE